MPHQARIDARPPRLSSQWRAGAGCLASYHMQRYQATKHFLKTLLTTSEWQLNYGMEEWPEIEFFKTAFR